jgi:hypothetical protein
VVAIFGRRQVEQGLEQAVDVRRGEQVAPADDMSNALRRVVDGDGEVVGGWGVLPGEDDVAMRGRVGEDCAGIEIVPL